MTTILEVQGNPSSQEEQLVDELLNVIQAKSPKLAEAAMLAAVPYRFDCDLLAALRAANDGLEDRIIVQLDRFSFLGERDGYYFITDSLRQRLLSPQRADKATVVAAHRRALAYFDGRLAASSDVTSHQREELMQARLYHLLAVDPGEGINLLLQLFRQSADEFRPAAAEQYLRIAEEQRCILPSPYPLYLDYLHGALAQLNDQWEASRTLLEKLLTAQADELPPDLLARIRRELGRAWARQGSYKQATILAQQALDGFQVQGNRLECALTLIDLGSMCLNLALEVWGGGEPFLIKPPRYQPILDVLSFVIRLPLVIYLVTQLGLRPLLPVLHRIGSHMDWLVARLFVDASKYFQQASAILLEIGDTAGVVQVQEQLGRLYLSFNHPHQSERIWRDQLERYGAYLDAYRMAVAQLGLGWVLLRQGKLTEARSLLEQVEPVFRGYGHLRRMAQCQTLLAQLAVREKRPTAALPHYLSAQKLWQQAGYLQEATDVLHQMEALARLKALSTEDRDLVKSISSTTSERRYLTRYHDPLLDLFYRLSAAILVIVILFTLSIALTTKMGTEVNATAALVKPIDATEDEWSPSLQLDLSEQLRPSFRVQVAASAAVMSLTVYLLLYSLTGLLFIMRTSLHTIMDTDHTNVRVEPTGIGQESGQGLRTWINWENINAVVMVDRFRIGRFASVFSLTSLIGEGSSIEFDGYIRHYVDLQSYALNRVREGTPIYNLGFRVLQSPSTLVFFTSLCFLGLFTILAQFEQGQEWLATPFLAGYPPSAFYSLSYMGIALPLVWWFVVQPIRRRLIFDPASHWVWAVGGVGLLFTVVALLVTGGNLLTPSRPDITLSVLAVFLLTVAARHIVFSRKRGLRQSFATPSSDVKQCGDYIYSFALRLAVAVIATILLALIGWHLVRELLSYHHLVQGNAYLLAGEQLGRDDLHLSANSNAAMQAESELPDSHSRPFYEKALASYSRSLELRPHASVYNNRGIVLDQLGRNEEAIADYLTAIDLDQHELAYQINLALAYSNQAAGIVTSTEKIAAYENALAIYDRLLETAEKRGTPSLAPAPALPDRREVDQVRYFRASTYYAMARALSLESRLEYAQRAFVEYQWLIDESDPAMTDPRTLAAYYAGRGWSRFFLRYQYPKLEDEHTDNDFYRLVDKCIEDFNQAVDYDPDNVSAYTGLGWAYWQHMVRIDGCKSALNKGIDEATYVRYRQQSVDALTEAIRLQPAAAIHYRTRAQLKWLLRDCPGYTAAEIYTSAIRDYDQALARIPTEASWWHRRGSIYYVLADAITSADEKDVANRGAVDSLSKAVALEPTNTGYLSALMDAHTRLGMDQRKALDATLATAGHQPGRFDTYLRVGQAAYAADSFSWAVANLRAAIALEPDNYDANWLLARSLYGSKQYTDAIATLEHVLQIKPGQRDPLWLMAWSHYMLKQYEQAIQRAEQALQLRPNDSDLHWLRANAALQLGDTGQAAQAAAAALESAATSEESQKLVQFFKNNLHDETMVDQAADISIGLARTVTDFVQLSDSFRKSGEPEWALLAARRGAEMYTDTSDPLQPMHCHVYRESATEPLTKLACRAYLAKDFVLAIKAIRQAIALHPDDARLHFTLGAMQLAAGDKNGANLAYTTAIELADRLPGSDLRRARYNEALMNLRRIVDDPSEASTDFIHMLIEARDAR